MASTALRAVVIAGVALAVTAVALPTSADAARALLHVVVDNTDANPVPVRGTVNVGNLPAEGANPESFEARAGTTLAQGEAFGSAFITIPAGRRLTAEFLSVHVLLPPDQVPQVSFNALHGGTGGFVPLDAAGVTDGLNGPIANYTAAIPILDFQSSTFEVSLVRDLPGGLAGYPGEANLSVYLSGHLRPT